MIRLLMCKVEKKEIFAVTFFSLIFMKIIFINNIYTILVIDINIAQQKKSQIPTQKNQFYVLILLNNCSTIAQQLLNIAQHCST